MKLFKALALASSLVGLVVLFSCSDDDNNSNPGPGPAPACNNPTAGVVSGTQDTHCGTNVVVVKPETCHDVPDGSASIMAVRQHYVLLHGDGGEDEDAGADDGYGETQANAESDDDDCKYHVKWAAASDTPVCTNGDVFFNVTLTNKADNGAPVTGAPIRPEVFLNDTHPAPPTNSSSTETTPGVYRVGPVRFDASGQWTVRFHFHEECNDTENSPHGHAAFFVALP